MPAFSFKRQFVEPIRAGIKHHTIRAERKDGRIPAKVGDQLSLFCGMRTKQCFHILPGTVPCTRVQRIQIRECPRCGGTGEIACSSTHFEDCPVIQITIDGTELATDERERLAIADGFDNFAEMMKFWEGRLPFEGFIIHWRAQ
jgi:hypothetical protein